MIHTPGSFSAVITAGGRVAGEFVRSIGGEVKALAPVGGATLLDRAIAAARYAGADRIAVVGGDQVRTASANSVDRVIGESLDGAQNLTRALHAWEEDRPLLYLTSDMPFINGPALREFIDRVPPETLALSLAEWRAFETRFPGAPPYGVQIGNARVVNGGAFMLPAGAAGRIEAFAVRFFTARKSVWRMVALLGPALCAQFAMRRLSIERLEGHADRLLGVRARAIRDVAPELAYDVDTLDEYLYAAAHA